MKEKEKKKARQLRKRGWSINEITKVLPVSKGSVSRWVSDIALTSKQGKRLNKKQIKNQFPHHGVAQLKREEAKEKRKEYQMEGRKLLKRSNRMFVAGIMLFWAEGTKSRNSMTFSNSEPPMMAFFMKFLRKFFNVDEEKLKFSTILVVL